MIDLPTNLEELIVSVDEDLKGEGIPTHARPSRAIPEIASLLNLSLPLVPLSEKFPEHKSPENAVTKEIISWFEKQYGDHLLFDPTENRRFAVYAHGDLWVGSIPLMIGSVKVAPSKRLRSVKGVFNPFEHLKGLTEERLSRFSPKDMNEVIRVFNLACATIDAFEKFKKRDVRITKAETDWIAAVEHMTRRSKDFGQSQWSSLQMAEKFLKALVSLTGVGNPDQRHNLENC